jgi:hypothetical protein
VTTAQCRCQPAAKSQASCAQNTRDPRARTQDETGSPATALPHIAQHRFPQGRHHQLAALCAHQRGRLREDADDMQGQKVGFVDHLVQPTSPPPRAPGLFLTGVRLVIADHALGLPVLRTLSLCTCRRQYPDAAAGRILRSSHPAVSAFSDMAAGSTCTSSIEMLAQRSLTLRPAGGALAGHVVIRLLIVLAASSNCARQRPTITDTVATLAIQVRLIHPTTSSSAWTGTAMEFRPSFTLLLGRS